MVLLGLLVCWPLVHRSLVAEYGLNPWKFFGFAMYCVPTLKPRVSLHVDYGGRIEKLELGGAHLAPLRFEIEKFGRERGVWGDLARPDRVAEALFEVLTRAKGVEIEVIDPYFDLDTAKIAVYRPRYRYP
jgi:hypothetical protein